MIRSETEHHPSIRVTLSVVLLAAAAFSGSGCYPTTGPAPGPVSANAVTWASTRWPGVTGDSLSSGRNIFLAHCNACHGYPDVTAISDDRWPGILESMGKKAHLSPVERDEVLHFVLASRSDASNAAQPALAASPASAAPAHPPHQPAPGEWDKWTHEQRFEWMKAGVMPKMHDLFAAFDPSKYGNLGCKTCHGGGVSDGSFKMPNADLPKLDPSSAGFNALARTQPKMFEFMTNQVVPTMASLLGEPAYDMKTGAGFGCFECHTKKP
jgi:hypothetical protein